MKRRAVQIQGRAERPRGGRIDAPPGTRGFASEDQTLAGGRVVFNLGKISSVDEDTFNRLVEISREARDRRRKISSAEVKGWFSVHGKKLAGGDVELIVKLVNAQRVWARRPRDRVKENRDEVDIQKAREILATLRNLQSLLRHLRSDLPWLRDTHSKTEPEAEVTLCLSLLVDAVSDLRTVAPHLFEPPAQGRPSATWRIVAHQLKGPVEKALRKAGLKDVSCGDNSPLVTVTRLALEAIGEPPVDKSTVARELRKHPGKN
jgi:hypothetical protein